MSTSYETHASGIRIHPGKWRPHYSYEHIAWISPPWPCQDYIWLDFPEALFANGALYYLSHVNPRYPSRFENLPAIEWRTHRDAMSVERTLPDGVRFEAQVSRRGENSVDLVLSIENNSHESLREIRVQTCAYLRALREFNALTNDNKFVHTPSGWMTLTDALLQTSEAGSYRVGWRGGVRVGDVPLVVCRDGQAERWIGMTWFDRTFNLTGNSQHPCLHADPAFPDLEPGASAAVRGAICFFEGPLQALQTAWLHRKEV